MATDPGTLDFLLDQLGTGAATFTAKRMFGEYCLYRDGTPVALICDDVLFVKDTPPGRDAMAGIGDVAFGAPYPGARPHLRLPPDLWDDGDALRRLLDSTAAALPPPKPKKASASRKIESDAKPAPKRAAGVVTAATPVARDGSAPRSGTAKKAAVVKRTPPRAR